MIAHAIPTIENRLIIPLNSPGGVSHASGLIVTSRIMTAHLLLLGSQKKGQEIPIQRRLRQILLPWALSTGQIYRIEETYLSRQMIN